MAEARRSPTLARRLLSLQLLALREHASLTSTEVSRRLEWSSGRLTKMERNEWVRPDLGIIRQLLDVYDIQDAAERERFLDLARQGRERGWWTEYRQLSEAYSTFIGLEAGSSETLTASLILLPGLLQTPEYARAVILDGSEEVTEEQVKERVKVRMQRQELLTRPDNPLRLWAVLDEAALRRQVGGPDVMRGQLHHLLKVAGLAKVTIQVLPFASGAHAAATGPFAMMRFPAAPEIVCLETPAGQMFVEEAGEIARFRTAFERLLAEARSPADSLELIATVADTT